jgi:hypothetical protein
MKNGLEGENVETINKAESPVPSGLLTVQEVAAKLRVKSSWVYFHADILGAYRVGKYLRFSWDSVLHELSERSAVGLLNQLR